VDYYEVDINIILYDYIIDIIKGIDREEVTKDKGFFKAVRQQLKIAAILNLSNPNKQSCILRYGCSASTFLDVRRGEYDTFSAPFVETEYGQQILFRNKKYTVSYFEFERRVDEINDSLLYDAERRGSYSGLGLSIAGEITAVIGGIGLYIRHCKKREEERKVELIKKKGFLYRFKSIFRRQI
jgi:hypothetical protein